MRHSNKELPTKERNVMELIMNIVFAKDLDGKTIDWMNVCDDTKQIADKSSVNLQY